MTGPALAALGVTVAAAVLALPSVTPRRRWRGLALGAGRPRSGPAHTSPRWRRSTVVSPGAGSRRATVAGGTGTALVAATLGAALAGPVAGVVAGAYAATGAVLVGGHRRRRASERSTAEAVDAVAALAAELRAGVSVGTAFAAAPVLAHADLGHGGPAGVIARRVAAAVELAETSGAPLAEVLDRLDADLRSASRVRAAAAAQAAGARASAWLLAGMPVAGVLLGYAIGTDPLWILWHTPLGSAAALLAVALQLLGLAWADRLARVEVPT